MTQSDDQNSAVVQADTAETSKDAHGFPSLFLKMRSGSWRGLSLARLQALFPRRTVSRPSKQNANWREWSRFRLWRRTRPLTGSILILLAGILVLWGPIELLPFALLPGSNIWAGVLVGGILFMMGLIQLLSPANALVTGAIAVVLSLVSLLVAAGGFGIGMLLGIIGGAMGIAWQPVSRTRTRAPQLRQPGQTRPVRFQLHALKDTVTRIIPSWLKNPKNPFLRSHS